MNEYHTRQSIGRLPFLQNLSHLELGYGNVEGLLPQDMTSASSLANTYTYIFQKNLNDNIRKRYVTFPAS